jgi:hypothetical protein
MQRIEGSRPPCKAMCLLVFADHIAIDTNRLPVIGMKACSAEPSDVHAEENGPSVLCPMVGVGPRSGLAWSQFDRWTCNARQSKPDASCLAHLPVRVGSEVSPVPGGRVPKRREIKDQVRGANVTYQARKDPQY